MLAYCHVVLAVGSDTTKSLLSGLAVALGQFPAQRERLVADRDLMPSAIEEGLRWTTPGRGFVRAAVADTQIGEQKIRAGQYIYLLFAAGNFDPEVFECPRHQRAVTLLHVRFSLPVARCRVSRRAARLRS